MENINIIFKTLIENLEEGIHIVDNKGKTIYYNASMAKVEGLDAEEVMGKKVNEYLKGVEEESSTLMNAVNNKKKSIDVIQQYNSNYGKNITTINTTIPVIKDDNIIAALEISKDMTHFKELTEKICKLQQINDKDKNKFNFKDIVGASSEIKKSINIAQKASMSTSPVLIYGETGTGKEVFAQSIHNNGIRKDEPFIPINCAAIPSSLLESMLFGTVKGSFTGSENKKGLFSEANNGTLLLDEINSLEPYLQSKLLRVLQDGYIRPIGSNNVIDLNVRIIATLNEEPLKLIEEGKMRKDFYYRLSVIRINIPPLRERKEDILEYSKYFLQYYNNLLGKSLERFSGEVLDYFLFYQWPGNIRELKNCIEAAINMVDNNETILYKEYFNLMRENNKTFHIEEDKHLTEEGLMEYMDSMEKKIIYKTLTENDYNISKTAKVLKITRQNLQYKIKKYKLL